MLMLSMFPSAFSPAAGVTRVQGARPAMQPAPRMVIDDFITVSMSTIDAVQQNLPATTNLLAGLKSPADELLDELARAFPIVFSGRLSCLGFQYVKETIKPGAPFCCLSCPRTRAHSSSTLLLLPIAGIFLVLPTTRAYRALSR